MRIVRIIGRYLVLSWRTQARFTVDFFLNILQFVFYTSLTIIFWSTLLQFSPTFAGWSLGELIVLNGLSISATSISLLFFGFTQLDGRLARGEIDRLLCRPIPLLVGLLGESVAIVGAVQQMLTGMLIMGIGFVSTADWPSIGRIALASVTLIGGALAVNLGRGCVALLAFRWGRTGAIVNFLFRFDEFQKYPLTTFPSTVQAIFTWLLPLIFVSTYPAMLLTGKSLPRGWGSVCGIVITLWILMTWFIQNQMLRSYASTGS